MKKSIYVSATLLLLAVAVILISGCVLPGTGTIHVRNRLSSGDITSLYIYPDGSLDKGSSVISSPLAYDELYIELGVDPGDYTVEAIIDGGTNTAQDYVSVEEGTIHAVWIGDGDVL